MAKTKQVKKAPCKTSRKTATKVSKPKKKRIPLARREDATSKLRLGTHMAMIFVVQPDSRTLVTIHTGLIPPATLQHLAATATQGFYTIEDQADLVEVWRQFLYSGKLHVRQDEEQMEWAWLADAYLLGKSLKDERFCNAVINAVIDKQFEEGSYPTSLASAVYAETKKGDRLRELIIDFHVWAGRGEVTLGSEDDQHGPEALKTDVVWRAKLLAKKIVNPKIDWPWVDACKYHTHRATPKCKSG